MTRQPRILIAALATALTWVLGLAIAAPSFAQGESATLEIEVLAHESSTDGRSHELVITVPGAPSGDEPEVSITAGAPVRSLSASPLSVDSPESAATVVLVIDRSGSMAGDPLAAAQVGATRCLNELPEHVEVGLVSYADYAPELVTPSTERDELRAAIRDLVAVGETATFDALLEANAMLEGAGNSLHERAGRFLVLMSDGEDTVSEATVDDAIRALNESGFGLFVLSVAPDGEFLGTLEAITDRTRSTLVQGAPDELARLCADVTSRIDARYRVSLVLDAPAQPGYQLALTFTDGSTASFMLPTDATAGVASGQQSVLDAAAAILAGDGQAEGDAGGAGGEGAGAGGAATDTLAGGSGPAGDAGAGGEGAGGAATDTLAGGSGPAGDAGGDGAAGSGSDLDATNSAGGDGTGANANTAGAAVDGEAATAAGSEIRLWLGASAATAAPLWIVFALRPPRRAKHRLKVRRVKPDSVLDALSSAVDGLLRGSSLSERIEMKLDAAAVKMRTGEFVTTVALPTIGLTFALSLLGFHLTAPIALIAGPLLAWLWVRRKAKARSAIFHDQLADALRVMAGSLRAGSSMTQAIASTAENSTGPIADELTRIVAEGRIGRDVTDSLRDMARRMDSEDAGWVAEAISLNRELGGNLSSNLENLANTIRARAEIASQVAVLSAEGKLTARILLGLPFFMCLVLQFLNPGYLQDMVSTGLGNVLIAAALGLMLVGAVWVNRLVKLEY